MSSIDSDILVLVVGAGPSGATAAYYSGRSGISVLLIDKKARVGSPVRCGEFIPRPLLRGLELDEAIIMQRIETMLIHTPDKKTHRFYAPGYMIDRGSFDQALVEKAKKIGIQVWLNTEFKKIDRGAVYIDQEGQEISIKPKLIIGGDGPNSRVGGSINYRNPELILGVQRSYPLAQQQDAIEIFIDPQFYGGYGWLFPKRDSANVGISIKGMGLRKAKELLSRFTSDLIANGKIGEKVIAETSGLIPVNGPGIFHKDNILLCGDALGAVHPITGSGIPFAIETGRIAGRYAAAAITGNDPAILSRYETTWQKGFQNEFERAKRRRRFMEENWADLSRIYKRIWPSFREYYDD
ncbi:MAG TPA: NAD(P)/FAD-dependent oxidoreductase [bacterium (Candidatus Stahlbacteria)]|nr:NAD(P)/FAD-dependent oxidoreductase [Candidatus Stahlbacteria bacterium]